MKLSLLAFLLAFSAAAQTPAVAPAPSDPSLVNIPVKLPASIGPLIEFNQLGSPKLTGALVAIYPVFGSADYYGSTVTEFLPNRKTDPATGRSFYAISTQLRQGFHRKMKCIGKFCELIGADIGPTFTGNITSLVTGGGPAAINVSLATSFTSTLVYQANKYVNLLFPVRALYVSNAGWNPVVEFGVSFNLNPKP